MEKIITQMLSELGDTVVSSVSPMCDGSNIIIVRGKLKSTPEKVYGFNVEGVEIGFMQNSDGSYTFNAYLDKAFTQKSSVAPVSQKTAQNV